MRASLLALLLPVFASCRTAEPQLAPVPTSAAPKLASPEALQCAPATPTAGELGPDGADPSLEWSFGRVAAPEDPKDVCVVADSNIKTSLEAVLALPAPAMQPASPSWDRHTEPRHLARVTQRFGLDAADLERLHANGFVVPARLGANNYAFALHELHQSQVPLLVTLDAILHAVYAGNDHVIADLEARRLRPLLSDLLARLHCGLGLMAPDYPAETVSDLDVYLTVARRLLVGDDLASATGTAEVEALVSDLTRRARAADAMDTVTLFGRERVVDFTQLAPRGHYVDDEGLATFFRSAMWLARLELNLVSRSSRSSAPGEVPDPRETPREVVLAVALSELATRTGAMEPLRLLDHAWTVFAGRREDVSPMAMAELARDLRPNDPELAVAVRAAIGQRFQRTARTHYMPNGSKVLPAIFTLLGPRIVADAAATRPIVHGEIPERFRLGGADFGYLLGQDRAKIHLASELAAFPELDAGLAAARRIMDAATATQSTDLYSAWLDAITALAPSADARLPSYMATPAYADLRLNTAITAFAQLRHNNVLMAASSYDEGGCEVPDGWVEPAPEAYAALIRYAERGADAVAQLDPDPASPTRAYFVRLGRILRTLSRIVDYELAGVALPEPARRFLAQVVEMLPGGTGGPPTYTGWYFDLFERREADGLKDADLIADVYTSSNAGVSYLGVGEPRFGVFVVDRGGAPRVMVGPVATAYEYLGELSHRLDDQAARALPEAVRAAPWAASYTVAKPPEPNLSLEYGGGWGNDGDTTHSTIVITAKEKLGKVTLTLLDHHREPMKSLTKTVGPGETRFAFKRPANRPESLSFEAIQIRVGTFQTWTEVAMVCDCASLVLGSFRVEDEAPPEAPPEAPTGEPTPTP